VARDPDHRGQRLVLVVQPQARLWNGPDLGQPVPAAPAQRLQADGLAGACASFPADPEERPRQSAGCRNWIRRLRAAAPVVQRHFYRWARGPGLCRRGRARVHGNDAERLYVRIDTPPPPTSPQNITLGCTAGLPSPDGQKGSIDLPCRRPRPPSSDLSRRMSSGSSRERQAGM
jgi:hypothetical protein